MNETPQIRKAPITSIYFRNLPTKSTRERLIMKMQHFGSATMAIIGVIVIQLCYCSGAYAGNQWTIPSNGRVDYGQANNASGSFFLQQTGADLRGTANNNWNSKNSGFLGINSGSDYHQISGTVLGGRIDGNRFTLTIGYNGIPNVSVPGTFIYEGNIDPTTGFVYGENYNVLYPKNKVRFSTVTRMTMVTTPSAASNTPIPPPAASVQQYKITGRPKTQLPVLPGSTTGSGGGFIQMTPVQSSSAAIPPVSAPGSMANTMPGGVANTVPGGMANTIPGGMANTIPGGMTNTTSGGVPNTTTGMPSSQQMGGAGGLTSGPGGTMQPSPLSSPRAPTFTGTWNIVAADGTNYLMKLGQKGAMVGGEYSPRNGTISGQVGIDGKLTYSWSDAAGNRGTGQFSLSGDRNSMTGTFSNFSDPTVVSGTWGGSRQSN
jgi:hypothetical protein